MEFTFGDVVLLDFPFTDRNIQKRRPGVVISQDAYGDVLLARITSRDAETERDLQLEGWKLAGLNIPSTIRVVKLASIHHTEIKKTIGRLSIGDRQALVRTLRNFVDSLDELNLS